MAQEEEEGAEDEEGREEGVVGFARIVSEGSTHGGFAASYVALRQIDFLLMAPMT